MNIYFVDFEAEMWIKSTGYYVQSTKNFSDRKNGGIYPNKLNRKPCTPYLFSNQSPGQAAFSIH